jgi:transposase
LFAALSYLEGKIISRTEEKHTHVEWLRFLKQIGREATDELDVHIVADNYATHKYPKVKSWLAKHPRFTMHFTPTGSSWMNLVERFFGDLTGDVVRGQFHQRRRTHPLYRGLSRAAQPQPQTVPLESQRTGNP